ncbi:hypothetical protein FOA43_000134 [Brettanomyces nanus]|uniref:Uncharacterized protein n=1 Tax=Eeniella nana TaxID=13502 RepID=A0A875RY51_EENNA|nr:uncharacterized protein FOA43_000134 [Brettanomyces nanus]QPG72832.1 hypothetical protein FOA43_000134 [Brettanomyces nanus]
MSFELDIVGGLSTASKSDRLVDVKGDLIAYTSGQRVIVCKLESQNVRNPFKWKRFYYTKYKTGEKRASSIPVSCDRFGFPLSPSPIIVQSQPSQSPRLNMLEQFVQSKPSKLTNISCIALSPNEQLLAIGEVGVTTGRILVYSLAPDAAQHPLFVIKSHRFGVAMLEFSPDSQLLCSLGVRRDSSMKIWSISGEQRPVLMADVTVPTAVIRPIWFNSKTIITLGKAHLKVWDMDSSCSFKGHNILIQESLSRSKFIDAAVLGIEGIIILASDGRLGYLDLDSQPLYLSFLTQLSSSVLRILVDYESMVLTTAGDGIQLIPLSDTPASQSIAHSSIDKLISGMWSCSHHGLIYLNDGCLYAVDSTLKGDSCQLVDSLKGTLTGLKRSFDHQIVAWSAEGDVTTFLQGGFPSLIASLGNSGEELTALDMYKGNLVQATNRGVVSFYRKYSNSYEKIASFQSHQAIVKSVIFFQVKGLLAAASGAQDGTISVFIQPESNGLLWERVKILSGKGKASVIKLLFINGCLLAALSDKTIGVYRISNQMVGGLIVSSEMSVQLTALPLDIGIYENQLLVSTDGRQLVSFSLRGFLLSETRQFADGNGLPIRISCFSIKHGYLLIGSSTGEVLVFDYKNGTLLAEQYGDSRITSIILDDTCKRLITASEDRCIQFWKCRYDVARAPMTPHTLHDVLTGLHTPLSLKSTPSRNTYSPQSSSDFIGSTVSQLEQLQHGIATGKVNVQKNSKAISNLDAELKTTINLLQDRRRRAFDDKENIIG